MIKKNKLLADFGASDLVAIITITGGFLLMALHINTVVGGITTMVVGYYFGRKTSR